MRPFPIFLRATLIACGLLVASLGTVSAQTLYKSVGADGRVVYSDQPPASGAAGKALNLDNLPVSVVQGIAPAPRAAPGTPIEPPAAQAARGDVLLYMAQWCGYCRAAKGYLGRKGIAYKEFDIDTPAGKAAFSKLGERGIPVLLTQGRKVSGFTPQSYDAVFAARK